MLLDIKMPGMGGVEVLKIAREMQENLPVLMMTAYATVETAVEAMKIGAADYLLKPFDIEAMLQKVIRQYESTIKINERVRLRLARLSCRPVRPLPTRLGSSDIPMAYG